MLRLSQFLPELARGGGPGEAWWRGNAESESPLHHAASRRGPPPPASWGRNLSLARLFSPAPRQRVKLRISLPGRSSPGLHRHAPGPRLVDPVDVAERDLAARLGKRRLVELALSV